MGTRHLIAVFSEGEYKVAQYGQWDGYPKGQGVTVLKFLREVNLDLFKEKLRNCYWIDEKTYEDMWVECGAKQGADTVSMDVSEKFSKKYPHLSRDTGAGILNCVYRSKKKLPLQNSIDFANDSLMCEYGYVIDLDSYMLEVYRGFNTEPTLVGSRFFGQGEIPYRGCENTYYPIKLLTVFSLEKMPTNEQFLEECESRMPKDEK